MSIPNEDQDHHIALAAQNVLLKCRQSLSLDQEEIDDLTNRIEQEARRFKELSQERQSLPERPAKKMDDILALLKDEHLIESYREAQNLRLDPDFIDLLRNEIIRRGQRGPVGTDGARLVSHGRRRFTIHR